MFQVCSAGVNFREHYSVLAYVGESPAGSLVDKVYIYCISCGSWLGWRIVRNYIFNKLINFLLDLSICYLIFRLIIMEHMLQIRQSAYHPVIRVGHFVLVCDGDVGIEAVFPM